MPHAVARSPDLVRRERDCTMSDPSCPVPQWALLFELNERPGMPLQARLRLAIVEAVLAGRLAPKAALPSSRELARVLGLSRNTVTSAYLQLIDEGYLESRPRSGVFVTDQIQAASLAQAEAAEDPFRKASQSAAASPTWLSRLRHAPGRGTALSKPERWRDCPYPFVYGTHDPQLFPIEEFRECCNRTLAKAALENWTPDFDTEDVPDLIEQVRLRLLPKRGVFALPQEILITIGAQHAYHLLALALFDAQTRLGIEEPGHPHARNSFSVREPRVIPIPVDEEGIVVDGLPPLDYVFVTPSHQSPTTATLSLERRQWLLRKSELHDFVIIEDDYEAENLYDGAPMPALKSMDKTGRVVYIGSLAKNLSPALRLGYIVGPAELIAELRRLRHAMLRHPSTFLQHAYALFVALGHHDSHARRVNQAMQLRMQRTAEALRRHLPSFRFSLPHGGSSLWLQGPDWLDAAELVDVARKHGVLIEAGNFFYNRPAYPCPHVRLRLSSIAPAAIEPGIAALALAVRELAGSRGVPHPTVPASSPAGLHQS